VLLVDGDVHFCKQTSELLQSNAYSVTVMHMASSAIDTCKKHLYDLIIIDERLRDKTGMELMSILRSLQASAKIVLSSFTPQIRYVVNALKQGADYFLSKPFGFADISNVMNHQQMQPTFFTKVPQPALATKPFWDTASLAMKTVLNEIVLVASSDYSVIIYGESGSGKEMAARLIHEKSLRKEQPFVAVDCGTLTRELAGSVFFGHVKGAFTGAIDDRIGCFEQADGGTLFLDEIGNLPTDIQTYLLRAMQEKKFRRIGGNKEEVFNVRVIVASNLDLKSASDAGHFREDLFHRLNEFRIDLPALRDRQEDLQALCTHFISEACTELGRQQSELSAAVEQRFKEYAWPGNIRELRNVIRRGCLLTGEALIQLSSLPGELNPPVIQTPIAEELSAAKEPMNRNDLKSVVEIHEKRVILLTLQQAKYNKTRAAEIMNIDRKTLYNKMRTFDIPISSVGQATVV